MDDVIEWHAVGEPEPYRLYVGNDAELIWRAQLALGNTEASISHARGAYVRGDIEIDEFERRMEAALGAPGR